MAPNGRRTSTTAQADPQLVHTSHHAVAFNTDFYVMAATVIPVLFIPLIFPGGILYRYGLWTKKWRRQGAVKAYQDGDARGVARYNQGYKLLFLPVDLVLLLGGFGELCAVFALYRRHATHIEQMWTLYALVGLVGASVLMVGFAMSADFAKSLQDGGDDET